MTEIKYEVGEVTGEIEWVASEYFGELKGRKFDLGKMEAVEIARLEDLSEVGKLLLSAVAGAIIQHLLDAGVEAGELVDEFFFGEMLSFLDVDEGDVGALEEFFHVAGVAAWLVLVVADTVFKLDGAEGAKRAFITEDEVDGFVVNEAVGGVAVLGADFVAEEGREANFGDDVEFGG